MTPLRKASQEHPVAHSRSVAIALQQTTLAHLQALVDARRSLDASIKTAVLVAEILGISPHKISSVLDVERDDGSSSRMTEAARD